MPELYIAVIVKTNINSDGITFIRTVRMTILKSDGDKQKNKNIPLMYVRRFTELIL